MRIQRLNGPVFRAVILPVLELVQASCDEGVRKLEVREARQSTLA